MSTSECSRPRCTSTVYGNGLCNMHASRWYRFCKARGDFDKVDAELARRHLEVLHRRGWSWLKIGNVIHLGKEKVRDIASGRLTTLRRREEALLLGIEPAWLRSAARVPAIGTRRRCQALAYMGWSKGEIARAKGISLDALWNAASQDNVLASTAAAVADFFDEHVYTPGPSHTLAGKARKHGAVPAAAWADDIAIDDPDATPLVSQIRGVVPPRGRWPGSVHLDDVAVLRQGGTEWDEIASRLGVNVRTVRDAWNASQRRAERGVA